MSNTVNETVHPIEAFIALFKACELWADYCVAAESSGDSVPAEVILRERLTRLWAYQRLSFLCEGDQSRRLSFLEAKFFEDFSNLGKSRRVTTKHRILSKHHPTTEHLSTPSELFDNAGITIDRGEILIQTSRGPCLKLVEINHDVSAAAIGISGEAAVARPTDSKTIVENYIATEEQAGREPTQRGCATVTGLKRSQVRKVWPPNVALKPGRRYPVT